MASPRIPLFNALAARPDVDERIFFLAEEDPRRRHYDVYRDEFRFDWGVLRGIDVTAHGRWLVLNVGTRRALRRFDPDVVVVGGWNQPAMWAASAFGRPTVVWVESTLRDERPGHPLLERAKRRFAGRADAFVVPGRASAAYVRSLGVTDERIHVAPNAVDGAIFGGAEERPHEGCVFVYVGRLDPEKGLDVLVRAFGGVDGELLVVGSGSEEARLRTLAPANVYFVGARSREEVADVYAGADVFVLPSLSEPWGMVLNEAAAAGLALVATDAVGAAHELVEERRNGFVVPAGDADALHAAMQTLAANPALRRRFGERSREIAARFTPEAWAAVVTGLCTRLARAGPVGSSGYR
jgi:glycosyltransferase involved in cell wall biosynthesis